MLVPIAIKPTFEVVHGTALTIQYHLEKQVRTFIMEVSTLQCLFWLIGSAGLNEKQLLLMMRCSLLVSKLY